MSVHRIHPHVVNHGRDRHNNQRRNNFNFDRHDDVFKNLDHVFHDGTSNFGNGHSFTATYSNNNGHITKHFSQDGKTVSSKRTKQMMKQMNQSMKNMDKIFDNDLGFGNLDHMKHNLDDMIDSHSSGHKHHNPFRKLADHFKK